MIPGNDSPETECTFFVYLGSCVTQKKCSDRQNPQISSQNLSFSRTIKKCTHDNYNENKHSIQKKIGS